MLFPEVVRLEQRISAVLKRHYLTFAEGGRPDTQRYFDVTRGFKNLDVREVDDVKEEAKFLNETTLAKSWNLPVNSKEAFTVLRGTTYAYFSLHSMDSAKGQMTLR